MERQPRKYHRYVPTTNLFLLYLLLSGNYIGTLFGCSVQRLFLANQMVKHTLGIFTLFYLIVVSDDQEGLPEHIGIRFLISIALYIWFLMSTRLTTSSWMLFMFLLMLIYTLQLVKQTSTNERNKEILHQTQLAAMILNLAVTLVGSFFYLRRQYREHPDFRWTTFILGKPDGCSSIQPRAQYKNLE